MDDELEGQSHASDFQQSSEKFIDYAYLLIKGSFGSSEMTIPQMCQTDCPVLTSRRHAWTPRPRSVC